MEIKLQRIPMWTLQTSLLVYSIISTDSQGVRGCLTCGLPVS